MWLLDLRAGRRAHSYLLTGAGIPGFRPLLWGAVKRWGAHKLCESLVTEAIPLSSLAGSQHSHAPFPWGTGQLLGLASTVLLPVTGLLWERRCFISWSWGSLLPQDAPWGGP